MSQREVELLKARLDVLESEFQEFRADFGEFLRNHMEIARADKQHAEAQREHFEAQRELDAVQGEHIRQLICDMVIVLNVIGRVCHINTNSSDIKAAELLRMLSGIKADMPLRIQEAATAFGILESIWQQSAAQEGDSK